MSQNELAESIGMNPVVGMRLETAARTEMSAFSLLPFSSCPVLHGEPYAHAALSGLGRIQLEPVAEISRVLEDPGGNVPVWRAPDRALFYQNTQLFERSAHDLKSVFLFLQERVENQGQVPAVSDDASQSRA
jgi:hypothetical protein